MKKQKISAMILGAVAFAFALGAGEAQAQRQTFNLPAYFSTNVYLSDDTNTPLRQRISGSSITNVSDWSESAATTNINAAGFGVTNVGYVQFDTAYTNGIAEGRLQWNSDAEKLEYGLVDGGLTLKIGDANIMRVRASENILKGQVVSASGQTGNARPNAILSDADSTNLTRRVPTGIALQNINNNASGYIVTAGLADGIDTTGYPQDVPLYLGTTPGGLTTNKPGHPYNAWIVGESVLSNANGQLVLNISPCKQWAEMDEQYLSLSGGTMSGPINMNDQELNLVNAINYSTNYILSLADGEFAGIDAWTFAQQPTIPGYLTSTGAAATYLAQTNAAATYLTISNAAATYLTSSNAAATYLTSTGAVAEYVALTNLSAIAGSGLDVVSNQLVATNVVETFESLTGDRMVLGDGDLADIVATSKGAVQFGTVSGTATIGGLSFGASQRGSFSGTATIGANVFGASQVGWFSGTASIANNSVGALQQGWVGGSAAIGTSAFGASQIGYFPGAATIGNDAIGAMQVGRVNSGSTATNNAIGAIQLMGGTAGNYLTTSAANGSILLGPGTNSVAYSVKAKGGFYGDAANLTNFPSSLLRVSAANANYYRVTTAPTGSTAYGEAGQIAVSGTNVYIYSENALGTGTGRWGRISMDVTW